MENALLAPYGCTCPMVGELVVIVAEPGMGKTHLERSLMRTANQTFSYKEIVYLRDDPTNLSAGLTQVESKVRVVQRKRSKQQTLIVLDGFPAVEEDRLVHVAKKLRSFLLDECAVIISMRPEAEHFLDFMPEAQVVRSTNLLYRKPIAPDAAALTMWRHTKGIPALVQAYLYENGQMSTHYLDELRKQIVAALRSHLTQEERNIRSVMFLLGAGDIADLETVIRRVDSDTLSWLEAEAPLFGVDSYQGTFSCTGLTEDEFVQPLYNALRTANIANDEIKRTVFEVLIARQDYVRAGICCALLGIDTRIRQALRRGPELALSGAAMVVRDCVHEAHRLCMDTEPGYAASKAVLDVLQKPFKRAKNAVEQVQSSSSIGVGAKSYKHIDLLFMARKLTVGGVFEHRESAELDDALSEALIEHCAARYLLFEGKPYEALERLASYAVETNITTIPGAFLFNDVLLASVMTTGQLPPHALEYMDKAHVLFENSRLMYLASYEEALVEVCDVLCGGRASLALDRAIANADQAGDSALQCFLLIMAAISDIRKSNYTQAHVRINRAVSGADSLPSEELTCCAKLIQAIIRALLGEQRALVEYVMHTTSKTISADLGRLLVASDADNLETHAAYVPPQRTKAVVPFSANSNTIDTKLRVLSVAQLNPNAVWLVALLTQEFGTISERFMQALPQAWRYTLSRYGMHGNLIKPSLQLSKAENITPAAKDISSSDTGQTGQTSEPLRLSTAHRVDIALLGGFRITADGVALPPESVNRRRARALLGLLSAREGHKMRRVEIIEDLWPKDRLELGTQRLYEAVASARKILGAREKGFDPFIVGRTSGTLALNTAIVHCDVDEFEHVVSSCIAGEGGDETVVRNACKVQDLYLGSLDLVVRNPPIPWIEVRAERLLRQFIDAMVLGGHSALRIGRVRLALRFAQAALAYDQDREDVMTVYIECLCADNRYSEARTVYHKYSEHIIKLTNMPPSRDLRRLGQSLSVYENKAPLRQQPSESEFSISDEAISFSQANFAQDKSLSFAV